ncbi:MAG: hypothetical protein CMO55_24765 [Verrucomicrobiales bacterium]|nr:hypothetical protein [Verrucomicrobiales bacterium]
MNLISRNSILSASAILAAGLISTVTADAQTLFTNLRTNQPVFQKYQGNSNSSSSSSKKKEWSRTQHISKPVDTKKLSYKSNSRIQTSKPSSSSSNSGSSSQIDRSKMVSILKGQVSTSSSAKTTPVVTSRKTKIDPKVLPKGYQTFQMKQGRPPATGTPDKLANSGGSKTLYMKKGKSGAEGIPEDHSDYQPTRIKDGRPMASGHDHGYQPDTHSHNNGNDYGSQYGSNSGSHSAAPAEISYEVDTSSRLATNVVKFQKGSTNLADELSYRYLLTLSEALSSPELAGSQFVVEGHASADGSSTANLILSQQRANAIYDFLISRGVSADRLLAVGHGEAHARFQSYEPEYLLAQDRQVIVFKLAN